METPKLINPKNVFIKSAIVGSFSLFVFYFVLLFLVTRDLAHPITQFLEFQPWMSILIVGFGVQVGLYSLLKKGFRLNLTQKKDTKVAASAGGAMSGVSMVACCAHHVVDVLPILGVSGAALFLTEYQKEFLILGVFANAIGILYMSWLVVDKQNPNSVLRSVFAKGETS